MSKVRTPKWQIPLIETFVKTAHASGAKSSNDEELDRLLMVEVLQDISAKERVGYWKMRNFNHKSRAAFLSRCKPLLRDLEAKEARWCITKTVRLLTLTVRLSRTLCHDEIDSAIRYGHTSDPFKVKLLERVRYGDNMLDVLVETGLSDSELLQLLNNQDWCDFAYTRPASMFGSLL